MAGTKDIGVGGDGDCLGERACVHRGGHGSREAHVQDQGWYGDVFRAVGLERRRGVAGSMDTVVRMRGSRGEASKLVWSRAAQSMPPTCCQPQSSLPAFAAQ